MLVDAHAGGIDHHQFTIISGGNRCQKPVPDPGFAPADKPVVASGGISSLEDIKALCALNQIGVEGAIVGKALYAGAFTLSEALARVSK